MKLTSRSGRLSCIGCLLALPWLFLLVLMAGCPAGGGGDGNGNNNGNNNGNGSPDGRGEIVTPSSSFGLSLFDQPFQVRYSVPEDATDIRGYRFPVADSSLNSPSIGEEVTIAVNLTAGDNQFFDFDPSEAGVGYHRVGISFNVDGDSETAESSGVIHVEGSPDPVFILPAQALTQVEEGDTVTVSFDARDPENNVQWRLFALPSGDDLNSAPDQLGVQIAVGSGNAATVTVRTDGLPQGDYLLGVSATDSGMSISATVAAGELDRIVTIPRDGVDTPRIRVVPQGTITVPTITVTNPGNTDVELFRDGTFTVRFTATVPAGGPAGTVEVFYDTDTNPNNGFTIIADDLPSTETEVEFPSGIAEGTYFVGATIRDGINNPATDYATGRVIVTRTITLSVTEPNTTLAVAPGTPVEVIWTTNAPDSSGTVDVFAQRLTTNNQPTGAPIPIVTAGEMSMESATFTSATSGLFQITVRLNIIGQTAISQNSPRPVRYTSLPAIAWIGMIAETNPRIDGAIFGGVNFEDNAGSSFTKADDFDEDGLNEFVISARYGKPFFVNPSGIGIGEAYVIYGERAPERLQGVYNLNSVGSPSLRGVTFTGIRPISESHKTEGLSDVLSIPDADGDGKDDLAFGFPRVESRSLRRGRDSDLDRPNQFLGGGVVIVSSENAPLLDPDAGSSVINLDLVGLNFTNTTITPLDRTLALLDRFRFEEGTPADPDSGQEEIPDSCVLGTDSVFDSVIGPNVGFVDFILPPCTEEGGTEEEPGFIVCPNPELPGLISQIGLAPAQAWYLFPDGNNQIPQDFRPLGSPPAPAGGPAPAEQICETQTDVWRNNPCDRDNLNVFNGLNAGSGFYPANAEPLPPFGARILGRQKDDRFGTTLSFNEGTGVDGAGELIFSAPNRSATPSEIEGITLSGSGIGYITRNRNFWGEDAVIQGEPPKPHQYMINFRSHCSVAPDRRAEPIFYDPTAGPTSYNDPDAGAIKVVGDGNDHIENLMGIDDFNGDGRNDLAVGAPTADFAPPGATSVTGSGRVYIVYRRQAGNLGLEGDMILGDLLQDPANPQRLDGLLITSATADAVGASIASGFDFNGDGVADLVFGSPNAGNGTGEVIIVFGGTGITSEAGGITVQTLLNSRRTASGAPVAVRIRGATAGGEAGRFGFNIANAGDVDGDGKDDLLIAAPEASPRFDSTPNDGVDELTTKGIDNNLDGVADQVPGDDTLDQAGLVYLIMGSNRLDQVRTCGNTSKSCLTAADCPQGTACILTDATINIDQLGTSRLRGLMIAGRRAGDRIGGGDASDPDLGGIDTKAFGRSRGLGTAGDVDGDGRADFLIGSIVADPRRDPNTGVGVRNGGEAYLIYGSNVP